MRKNRNYSKIGMEKCRQNKIGTIEKLKLQKHVVI